MSKDRYGLAKLSLDEITLLNQATNGRAGSPAPGVATPEPEKKPEERPRARWDAVNKVWNTRLTPKVSDKYVTVVSTLLRKVAVSDLSVAQDTVAAAIAEEHASLGAYNTQVYFCGDKGGTGAEVAQAKAEVAQAKAEAAELKAQVAELMALLKAKA